VFIITAYSVVQSKLAFMALATILFPIIANPA